jgi:Fe2+ transport system protein B
MSKLTEKQIESKAKELSDKLKNKVTPIVITDAEGNQIIGYFQEPSYDVIMYATDAYIEKQISKAAEATLRDCLIAEESDARITSTLRSDAKIKASFTNACLKFVSPFVDEYKKK